MSPKFELVKVGRQKDGLQFEIMQSRPGFCMCENCLEVLPQKDVEEHECIEWWHADQSDGKSGSGSLQGQ